MTPAVPGHALCSVTPDVLPSHQHHCNVDKWRSVDVQSGADIGRQQRSNGVRVISFVPDSVMLTALA